METTDDKNKQFVVKKKHIRMWLPPEVVNKIQGKTGWAGLEVAASKDTIQYYFDGELVIEIQA